MEEENTRKEIFCHGIIGNIPAEFHSADLRAFFSQFIEGKGFHCFHFRHRPEVMEETSSKGKDSLKENTTCCVVRLSDEKMNELIRMYREQNWVDKAGKLYKQRAVVLRIKVGEGHGESTIYQTRTEKRHSIRSTVAFLTHDLRKLPELNPPPIMPNGNVGTPLVTFIELIRTCKFPPKLIKKLGLTFPRSKTRKYGNVPFDYQPPDDEIYQEVDEEKLQDEGTCNNGSEIPFDSEIGVATLQLGSPRVQSNQTIIDPNELHVYSEEVNLQGGSATCYKSDNRDNNQTTQKSKVSSCNRFTRNAKSAHSPGSSTCSCKSSTDKCEVSDNTCPCTYKKVCRAQYSTDREANTIQPTLKLKGGLKSREYSDLLRKFVDRKGVKKVEKESRDDNSDGELEDWERHEALHDDVDSQGRTKERLYENKIELKWEKGGSGLVWYTDAAFWKQQEEADFDEETVDDWDIDMGIYEEEGAGDKDAKDLLQMRVEEQWRSGNDIDFNRVGGFERFTRGIGGSVMRKHGWNEGQSLGSSQVGITEPLAADGQIPSSKRGLGYYGEKLNRHPFKRPRATRDIYISTIYDKADKRNAELYESQGPHTIKYRDNVNFVPAKDKHS